MKKFPNVIPIIKVLFLGTMSHSVMTKVVTETFFEILMVSERKDLKILKCLPISVYLCVCINNN